MKKIIKYTALLVIIVIATTLIINIYVKTTTKKQIVTETEAKKGDIDCIIVLGAGIWGDKPSPMLEDRLLQAISLYNNGVSDKIIMSGDHGKTRLR